MLTALSRALALLAAHRPAPALPTAVGHPDSLADHPAEDPAVYDMLCKADSIGVFQIESPRADEAAAAAQAAVLLRPRHLGGDRPPRPDPGRDGAPVPAPPRRQGAGPLPVPAARAGPREDARGAALPGAGRCGSRWWRRGSRRARRTSCGGSDAPALAREARGHEGAASRRDGGARHHARRTRRLIFHQLLGFAGYGFPESHSASFALLVYASAWTRSATTPPRSPARS